MHFLEVKRRVIRARIGSTSKNPGRSRGFDLKRECELHGRDKVGNHDRGVFLEQLRHAGRHAGVHRCGAESIDANTFAGLGESVLGKSHQDANSNLHRVAAQGFEQFPIDCRRNCGQRNRPFPA